MGNEEIMPQYYIIHHNKKGDRKVFLIILHYDHYQNNI